MQTNLILKLSNDKEDEQSYSDTASIIEGINALLEGDSIKEVEIIWIDDKVTIKMQSGKALEIKGKPLGLEFKFGNTIF